MELVLQGRLKLFMSEACLEEIEDVLRRPEVRQSFPNLTNEKVDEFVALVRIVAEFIDPVPHAYDLPADPDDERYINLAIACGGVFLVSWDKHLRNLANPNHPEGMRFRKAHPTIAVMDPREFLAHYHGKAEVPRKPTR
jgi:putative PIN family toxin of toxin-antitoxin system